MKSKIVLSLDNSQPVDLINEEDRPPPEHLEVVLGDLDHLLDLGHVGSARRQLDELGPVPRLVLALLCNDIGQTGLAAARGTPEDHGGHLVPLDQSPPNALLLADRVLAQVLLEGLGTHGLGQWDVGLGFRSLALGVVQAGLLLGLGRATRAGIHRET